LEARISQLEEELDEEQGNSEIMADRARKNQLQAEQLTTELAVERTNSQKQENARMQLERQNRDMKAKLSELESQMKTRSKATIASLESKIRNVEDQLESETK
jgi:myosin protein heavy chain